MQVYRLQRDIKIVSIGKSAGCKHQTRECRPQGSNSGHSQIAALPPRLTSQSLLECRKRFFLGFCKPLSLGQVQVFPKFQKCEKVSGVSYLKGTRFLAIVNRTYVCHSKMLELGAQERATWTKNYHTSRTNQITDTEDWNIENTLASTKDRNVEDSCICTQRGC